MRVRVWAEDGALRAALEDAGELERFSVDVAPGLTVHAGDATADGTVTFASGEQAWVDQGWLRAAGGFAAGSAAGDAFASMIERARRHGWVDPVTDAIAGHVTCAGAPVR